MRKSLFKRLTVACLALLFGVSLAAQPDKRVFPPFTIEVGEQDTTVDNDAAKDLADYMTSQGLTVEWISRPGIHYWNFWQECLPKALQKAGESFK